MPAIAKLVRSSFPKFSAFFTADSSSASRQDAGNAEPNAAVEIGKVRRKGSVHRLITKDENDLDDDSGIYARPESANQANGSDTAFSGRKGAEHRAAL